MSLAKVFVDGFLVEWEEGEYQAQVRMLPARSKPIAAKYAAFQKNARSNAIKAQAIRERLDRTARRVPEVVVKVTSSCRGMKQIGRHVDYISRKGLIEVEDQDGFLVSGKSELDSLKRDWRDSGFRRIEDESEIRDTLNIVFSMPAQTDEVGFKRAVRDFARSEFGGHEYVFAYHTPSTDPDPDPPDHPHIHLCLKLEGADGKRLNPRKADLKRWRDDFAVSLRSHGIEANSSSRLARLKRDRGSERGALAMLDEGRRRERGGASPERVQRAADLEKSRLEYYYAVTRTLSESEHPGDGELALSLARSVTEQLKKLSVNRSPSRDAREQDR